VRSLLALVVEPGCQVIDRPEIQQVITQRVQLLDREGGDAIDHRISDGSNLQTQPTDNPRSLLILCLEFSEKSDRLAGGMGDRLQENSLVEKIKCDRALNLLYLGLKHPNLFDR
jgi:hypothetical protein